MSVGLRQRELPERWPHAAALRALLTLVAVADALAGLYLWYLHHRGSRAGIHAALAALAPVRLLAAIALVGATLYLATRPKRAFQLVLVLVAVGGALLALSSSQFPLIAIAVADAVAALLAGSLWRELGDPLASRFGWILLGAAAAGAGCLFVVQHPDHRLASALTLVLVVAFAAGISALALLDRNPAMRGELDLGAAVTVFVSHARSGIAPFALMRDKRQWWDAGRTSFIAFGCRAGVAMALGPALGPPGQAARLEDEFRASCRRRGWRPAFYQVPEEQAERLSAMIRLPIGSEAMVDVDAFDLEGRRVANLRHGVARARRAGISVQVLREESLAPEVRAAMRRLASTSVAKMRLGEMTFSVGRSDDPAGVERTVGLAFDAEGALVAYVTWLWVPAASTQVLDEVRRDQSAAPGSMELLISTCLLGFRGKARRASLGLAPSAVGGGRPRLRLPAAGLASFKAKFVPSWEPRYLLVDRLIDIPAVLAALLLLHFPGIAHRIYEIGVTSARTASVSGDGWVPSSSASSRRHR